MASLGQVLTNAFAEELAYIKEASAVSAAKRAVYKGPLSAAPKKKLLKQTAEQQAKTRAARASEKVSKHPVLGTPIKPMTPNAAKNFEKKYRAAAAEAKRTGQPIKAWKKEAGAKDKAAKGVWEGLKSTWKGEGAQKARKALEGSGAMTSKGKIRKNLTAKQTERRNTYVKEYAKHRGLQAGVGAAGAAAAYGGYKALKSNK